MKRVGILGLPQSGKSTVFEILMQGAGTSPSGASRDQVGMVRVPDARVDQLAELFKPKKTTYTQIQFVDSAAAGHTSARVAAKGPDLFSGVRNCDMLMAVVRDFENAAAPSVKGVDPARDLRDLEVELIFNDLAICETRMERIEKELRIGKKQGEREHQVLARCKARLESERALRDETFDAEEEKLLRGFQLLTRKPLLAVYNQDENSLHAPPPAAPGTNAVAIKAHLEREIVALPADERPVFRAEMGIDEDGLSLLIRACYDLLGLISFFTVGPDEVRAWTITRGDHAVDAAGEIHSDLARGFIRAEVSEWQTLIQKGGIAGARTAGQLRLEGRDYEVHDGDCLEIRFNA